MTCSVGRPFIEIIYPMYLLSSSFQPKRFILLSHLFSSQSSSTPVPKGSNTLMWIFYHSIKYPLKQPMDKIIRFLGKWRFLPHRCKYSAGEPPLSGFYTISPHPTNVEGLEFIIDWIDKQQKQHNIKYQVDLSGSPHPQKFYGVDVDIVTSFKREDEFQVLKSLTYLKNNALLSEGVRKIGENPDLLIVEMVNYKGIESINIYQQYQRVKGN